MEESKMAEKQKTALSDKKMMMRAIKDSFIKLKPKTQAGNPVMLLVYLSAIMTTGLWLISLIFGIGDAPTGYTCAVAVILWFTVLFANFAEAIAEGRGKAQADSLRKAKKDVDAHKIPSPDQKERITVIPSTSLKKGDLVLVKAGEQIPGDGEVVDGAASVDESAITGESAPVIRESGGDRSAVTGGTTVLSDWIVVRITSEAGETFMDKMIAMVEGANRKKTPNEIALQIFLVALSIVFIMVTMSLYTYSMFSAEQAGIPNPTSITTLVALLVCLAPTTIGALLSAIGIAGMSRLNQANVLAMSGRAIEAAGDVDILMRDKTGTITLGNRRADAFIPVDGASEKELADAIMPLSSHVTLAAPMSEERKIVRTSILPSLLESAAYNLARSVKDVPLFEISSVYSQDSTQERFALVLCGDLQKNRWQKFETKADFYTIKGLVEMMLEELGYGETRVSFKANTKDTVHFHPYQSAEVYIGKDLLGIFGTIHPDMAKAYGVKQAVMGEFSMEVLLDNKPAKVKFEPISRYPSVSRDLAFVVDAGTAVADIIRSIKKCGKLDKENIIQDVEVFDVYAGEHVEEGKKSIALSITFQSAQRTLKDEDINQIHDKVLEALQKEVGAQLRA